MNTTTGPGLPTLAELAAELRALQAAAKHIKEQIDVTKAGILDLTQDSTTAGDQKIIVTRPKTVDYHALGADFPAADYPALYETKLSTAAVKAAFAPDVLAQYQTTGAPQVKLA